ncbi:MAG: OmpH family outer membrane protein [Nitrospira sp.]|nr:OmpH family outer membrane protein [Nitrospira sp.]MDD9859117.1 OmpH family outer membrane protein [Nitrospira sp.]
MMSVGLVVLGGGLAGCETGPTEPAGAEWQAMVSDSSTPVPFAVVDTQWLLSESKMGQQVTENLNQFMTDRQELMALEQEELRDLENEIVRLGSVLSPEAKQQKEEHLRQSMLDYQQNVEDMNMELQTKRGELLSEFRHYVDRVVQRIAQEQGVILVVEKGQNAPTRYYEPGLDLSEAVLDELDRMFVQ